MCIPKAKAIKDPKKLLNSCYPGPKLIASTAPEYRPSGNELSRLAYFASNAPTQLTTVGELLVQRANLEAKAFKSANGPNRDKAKAGLMLTLAITKNLIAECKRELNYFNPHAQSIISIALDASTHNPGGNTKRDIEISARTASTFYALATFTQAAGSSVDANVGKTYLELVRAFAAMCEERDGDSEDTNRIRLIAIGALSGAVGSDLFFGKTHSEQARQIVPALLASILPSHSVTLSFLQSESAKVSNAANRWRRRTTRSCDKKKKNVDARRSRRKRSSEGGAHGGAGGVGVGVGQRDADAAASKNARRRTLVQSARHIDVAPLPAQASTAAAATAAAATRATGSHGTGAGARVGSTSGPSGTLKLSYQPPSSGLLCFTLSI
ncbi:hypothetical protein A4X06_0g6068 [Tilletia controversa]|uniref:Uncharacterized protein n=1 Tax=Tilletia controversa TaxID=13291 RepID=A0A8X7MQV7_9BASI|nr:hypothetical protein A4X06_0g6068 [Tilletia controversa]